MSPLAGKLPAEPSTTTNSTASGYSSKEKTGKDEQALGSSHPVSISAQSGDDVTARIENLEQGGKFGFRLYTHDESRGYSNSSPILNISPPKR